MVLAEKSITEGRNDIIPIDDFIISLFNLTSDQIADMQAVKGDDDTLHVYVKTIPAEKECPFCGSPLTKFGHGRPKTITNSVLKNRNCCIHWTPQRFKCNCSSCDKTITERNPFGFKGFTVSYATIQNIMFDLKNPHLSFKDVAENNGVSITTVQRYFDSYVHAPRPRHLPESLGVDEIHSDMAKYGSAYLCVLVDNTRREVFDILPSRSKHELEKYFELFPREERDKVKYVTIDMWRAYEDVAQKMFRNCIVAVDPYHVVKHLVDCFTRLRISVMKQCEYGSPSYYLLKKFSWLCTAKDVDLDNEAVFNHVFNRYMNRRDLLEELLAVNDDLCVAYNLMTAYQDFNDSCPQEKAREHFEALYESFITSDIPAYREFVTLLSDWKEEIIHSFIRVDGRKLSNALTENINSQIRVYLAVARGSSHFERFRRRILYCLNKKVFYSCTSFLTSLKREGKKRGSYKKKNSENKSEE